MRYNSSANINGYIAGGTGDYKYRMFVDGDSILFTPGVPPKRATPLKEASSEVERSFGKPEKAVGLWVLLMGIRETE